MDAKGLREKAATCLKLSQGLSWKILAAFDLWIWQRVFKDALQNLKRKLNSNDSSLNRRNRRNAAPLFSFYRCLAPVALAAS